MNASTARKRTAFTLVEILVVITIIGILAGIAIPAITRALKTARDAAIRSEIDSISQAMEDYKLKHLEYPPDFTDWAKVERHFRKAYPNIDNNELRILAQFTHYNSSMDRTGDGGSGPADPRTSTAYTHYPHAIDRAEALVFCLGGYSKDKKHPFTGQGGPLTLLQGATLGAPSRIDYTLFQLNSEREAGSFDFDTAAMSVSLEGPAATPFAYSNDERSTITLSASGVAGTRTGNGLGFVFHEDPFPTYRPPGSDLPLVYFNSDGYASAFGVSSTLVGSNAWVSGSNLHHLQNLYLPAGTGGVAATGVARPYVLNVVDTTPPATISGFTVPVVSGVPITVLQFAENNGFQIISSGTDDNYGGVVAPFVGPASAGIGVYPSGEFYNPLVISSPAGPFPSVSATNKYQDDLYLQQRGFPEVYNDQPQLDNVTNFTTRTLGSDLP